MRVGFNWLNALRTGADSVEKEPEPSPQTTADQIVGRCQSPQTLGDLADSTGLHYAALTPLVTRLVDSGRLQVVVINRNNLSVIHYAART